MNRQAPPPPYRKLVSVRRVSQIKPLASSDTHEVVMIDGWPVVVPKGHFSLKEQVLYFAVDCVLPLHDKRYLPYRTSQFRVELHGQKGLLVQTVMKQGHISQGMVFRMDDIFPEIMRVKEKIEAEAKSKGKLWLSPSGVLRPDAVRILAGIDFQKDLKIRKWIKFYPNDGGISLGRPPSYFCTPKSERVQNIPYLWKRYGSTEFQITEIVDGISMIYYDMTKSTTGNEWKSMPGMHLGDGTEKSFSERPLYGVSIGEHDYKETESSMCWNAVKEQGMIGDIDEAGEMTLAGVLYGEGIFGNPHMIEGRCFSFYSVWGDEDRRRLWMPVDSYSGPSLNSVEPVPTFAERIRLSAFAKDLDELMTKAQGASCVSEVTKARHPSLKRKGLAFRSVDGKFSFRVLANDWLLEETETLRKAGQDGIVSRPGPNDCV